MELIFEGAKVTELLWYILNFIGLCMFLNLPNVIHLPFIVFFIFSSRGLCPWRAYVVTQALASVSALAQCLSFQMFT